MSTEQGRQDRRSVPASSSNKGLNRWPCGCACACGGAGAATTGSSVKSITSEEDGDKKGLMGTRGTAWGVAGSERRCEFDAVVVCRYLVLLGLLLSSISHLEREN